MSKICKELNFKIFITLILWAVASMILSGGVIFYANNILSSPLNWSYKYFCGILVTLGGIIIVTLFHFLEPWQKEYKKFLSKDISEETAFNISCGNVKRRPPKFILNKFRK